MMSPRSILLPQRSYMYPGHDIREGYHHSLARLGPYTNPFDRLDFTNLVIHPHLALNPEIGGGYHSSVGYTREMRRGSLIHPLRLRHGFVEDYDDSDWTRRDTYNARNPGSERHPTEVHNRSESPRASPDIKPPEKEAIHVMPLPKALKKLNRQIEISEQFYSEFKRQYNADIDGIKNYCPKSLLESMWTLRVKGDKQAQEDEAQDQDIAEAKEKFELRRQQTTQALKDVSNASLKDFKGNRLACAVRLKEKVTTYKKQISNLLLLAPKSREHCNELCDELAELKSLINPEADKNKGLFSGTNPEGDDGSDSEERNVDSPGDYWARE